MKKITFLLSTPRSGTLALANIMNTDKCIAHHEGNDFKVIQPRPFSMKETYAGQQLLKAFQERKNYFCCDQSMADALFRNFVSDDEFLDLVIDNKIQVNILSIYRDAVDCAKSYEGLGVITEAEFTKMALHIQQTALKISKDYGEVNEMIKLIIPLYGGIHRSYDKITKDNRFTVSAIKEISELVGAGLEGLKHSEIRELANTHYSLTKEQLQAGVDELRKYKPKMIDPSVN